MAETLELARHDVSIVLHKDTGRLAAASACLLEHKDEWQDALKTKQTEHMWATLEKHMPAEERDEFFTKHLGTQKETTPETFDYRVLFQDYMNKLAILDRMHQVRIVTTETAEVQVEKLYMESVHKMNSARK
jgi:hypothetical protein